jgi:DnaJ-class molecular chaperone
MGKGFLDGYKTYDTNNGFGNAKRWRRALYEKMSHDEAKVIIDQQNESPYTILNIPIEVSEYEIKKAFRKLITKWHPDKNPGQQNLAEEMSKKIIAAYTFLTSAK